MMNKCINCKERHPACQSHCPTGIALANEREQRKTLIKENKMNDKMVDEVKSNTTYKSKKMVGL